jgi:hypothetical protein
VSRSSGSAQRVHPTAMSGLSSFRSSDEVGISGIQEKSGNPLDTGSRLRLVRHDDCVVAEMMTGIKQMAGTVTGPTTRVMSFAGGGKPRPYV